MLYPRLRANKLYRSSINSFYGYDRRLKPRAGAFSHTKNLSTDAFPLLSARKPRGSVGRFENVQGMAARDALALVRDGTLYYNGLATPLTGMSEGEKQLVSMGAYICVFPDKLYYNTQNGADCGSMEARWSYTGQVEYSMCDILGKAYENVTFSAAAPRTPADGDCWADTKSGSLSRYSEVNGIWLSIESVYTKLSFSTQGQLPASFSRYDGIRTKGAAFPTLNGSKIIYAIGGSAEGERDYIVLAGEPCENYIQEAAEFSIERRVPDMDFVCQCQNRLWGCFYGNDGSENLNEVYACALGDFKNWEQFLGLSTDSWRASIGSDGVWTGAVSYLGSPHFFKEDRLHAVGISAIGAHSVSERVCSGVQQGSHKSLAVINETLFYKSRSEVCAYQGGFPQGISEALGDVRYHSAAGCGFGGKYYISMADAAGDYSLFVYDTEKGLWMRQDGLRADLFAADERELYCISGGELIAMEGSRGVPERTVDWEAETGLLCCSEPDSKYISRLRLRAAMEENSEMSISIEYDSSGRFEFAGRLRPTRPGSSEIPLRLRRCDHIRLRLCGRGDFKLISLVIEETRY